MIRSTLADVRPLGVFQMNIVLTRSQQARSVYNASRSRSQKWNLGLLRAGICVWSLLLVLGAADTSLLWAASFKHKYAITGDAGAMRNLGTLYGLGQEVPQDYRNAKERYEKAAAAGDAVAMTNLGILYERGLGVPQDHHKAKAWFEKAAAGGDATAMKCLGLLYQEGQGVPQDYSKAKEWFEKAAAGGDA